MAEQNPKDGPQCLPCPFIVGVGRSGTTLLRLMLDAHPEIAIPPETHFMPRLSNLSALADARGAFLHVLTTTDRWCDFGVSVDALREALGEAPLGVSACLRRFYELYAARFGKSRWGDKTPIYLRHMGLISALFPEAAFIHMLRDGRDVALSSRDLWFGPGRDIAKQARNWRDLIVAARAEAQHLPRYMEVRYESLLAAPEQELKRVCDFLQLDYCAEMLRYPETASERLAALQTLTDANGRIVATGKQRREIHAHALAAPDLSRAGRWRMEMTYAERGAYEAVAGALLRELGYETA